MRKLVFLTLVFVMVFQIPLLFAGEWTSDGKKFVSELAFYASKVRKYESRYVTFCFPIHVSFFSPDLDDESFSLSGMGISMESYLGPECLARFAIKYYKKSKIMKNIEKNYKILIRYDPEEYSKNPYRVLYYDKSMKYLVDLINEYGSKEAKYGGLEFMKKGQKIGYWREWTQEEWDFIKLVSGVKALYAENIRELLGDECFGGEEYCLIRIKDYLDDAEDDDIKEYYISGILKNGEHVMVGILAFKIGKKYYLAGVSGTYDFENAVDDYYAELLQYKPGYLDEKWLRSYVSFMDEMGRNTRLKKISCGSLSALIFYWNPDSGKIDAVLDFGNFSYYVPLPSGDGTRVYIRDSVRSKIYDVIGKSLNAPGDVYTLYKYKDYPIETIKRLIALGVEYYPEKNRYRVWLYKDSTKEVKEWLENRKKVDCKNVPSGDENRDIYCKIRIASEVLSKSNALLRHIELNRGNMKSKEPGISIERRWIFDRKSKKIFFVKYEDYPLMMEYIIGGRYEYYVDKKRTSKGEFLLHYRSGEGIWLTSEFPFDMDIEKIRVKTNY